MNVNRGIVSVCLADIKNYLKNGKLDQVVAIIKSYAPHALGDLTITLKDLSSKIHGTIHHKVINDGVYGKDNSIGVALILANVSVFFPKSSMHYINITTRNLAKVFCKDTVPGNGSGTALVGNRHGYIKPVTRTHDFFLTYHPPVTHQWVVEEFLEEEMLVSLSNHWLMVMWISFRNGSSSGYHEGLWWLIKNEEDDEMVVNIWREFIGRERFGNGMDLN
nr:hypothetical protein [Tanacetum cinerariifolium]